MEKQQSFKMYRKTRRLKEIAKPVICEAFCRILGLFGNGRLKKSLTVFLYHDVCEDPSKFSRLFNLNVSPAIFDRQINFIKCNFNVISPDDLLNGQIPPNAALVTFDDGFRSYFKNAVPILNKYGVPSMIFLSMEPIRGGVFWPGLLTYLYEKRDDFRLYVNKYLLKYSHKIPAFFYADRDKVNSFFSAAGNSFTHEVSQFIGELASEKDLEDGSKNPLIFYANHFFNHDMALLLSDEELLFSLSRNRDELKKYLNYRHFLSFPYGVPGAAYSDRQVSLLLKKGVRKIFSNCSRPNDNPLAACLGRTALTTFNDSDSRIWFQIFRGYLLYGWQRVKPYTTHARQSRLP